VLLLATFQLARLGPELTPYGYLWLVSGWTLMCAVLTTRTSHRDEDERVDRYLGGRRGERR
jgi:hypothetical protein